MEPTLMINPSHVNLTEAEWIKGIEFVTKVGQFSNGTRQEFIILSDVLGLETTVVELNHGADAGETEATLQGPFYVPGAPELPKGAIGLQAADDASLRQGSASHQRGRGIRGKGIADPGIQA